jgi:hypothetical protein
MDKRVADAKAFLESPEGQQQTARYRELNARRVTGTLWPADAKAELEHLMIFLGRTMSVSEGRQEA